MLVFRTVTRAGGLLGDLVFVVPLPLCLCMLSGGPCSPDSWGHHLLQVLPFDLAAAWRSESSVDLPACLCADWGQKPSSPADPQASLGPYGAVLTQLNSQLKLVELVEVM